MASLKVILPLFISSVILTSCSSTKLIYPSSGAVTLAQKASEVGFLSQSTPSVLGFSPIPPLFENRVLINSNNNTGIIESNGMSESFNYVGKFSPSTRDSNKTLTLAFSQKNPLWYAPISYFESRKIPTPAEGSKLRYLKKALGDEAVFLSNGEVIFSSNMTTVDEISGIQVPEDTLKKLIELSKTNSKIIIN